jgi:hypothetical protein
MASVSIRANAMLKKARGVTSCGITPHSRSAPVRWDSFTLRILKETGSNWRMLTTQIREACQTWQPRWTVQINDAPALVTAAVGLAFGHQSEITAEAAGAVIMDTSLKRVDELFTWRSACGALRFKAPSAGWR